jgi:hypothetical protein
MDKSCSQQDHRFRGKTGAVKNSAKNIVAKFSLCFFFLSCILSCGLESISYLDNIPEGDYSDTRTIIRLPSASIESYRDFFDYFVIYYRIYISEYSYSGTINTDSARRDINQRLYDDFIHFESYTINNTTTTVSPINQGTFPNRNYYQLEFEGAAINNVLGSGSLGSILEISFSPYTGENPVIILNDNRYTLQRANKGPDYDSEFYPKPDQRFLNHFELYDSSNAINQIQSSTNINADVYGRTDIPSRYTYVSMYIVAQGTSLEMPPQTIFSQPTFLGIFRLAEAN